MTRSNVYDDLQDAVEQLIKAKFADGQVYRVLLRQGVGAGDERVLEITVFFHGQIDGLAENAPLSLLSELRQLASDYMIEGFPFLNFLPASELAA